MLINSLEEKYPSVPISSITANLMHQCELINAAAEIKNIITNQFDGVLCALINNAGCITSRYMTTAEGFEQQFALNHLAGFMLTHELLTIIRDNDTAVLFTSAMPNKTAQVNWNDLMYRKRYKPLHANKQSKLCNMLTVLSLRELGLRACCVDPHQHCGSLSREDSAKIYLELCENSFDEMYYSSSMKKYHISNAVNPDNAHRLYDISLKLCGLENQQREISK